MNTGVIDIKALAKIRGCKIEDLLVLAPKNDPFYAGVQPAQRAAAEWVTDKYVNVFDSPINVHLRRLHYLLVSSKQPFIKPNGEPYQNTDKDWEWLCGAVKAARNMRLIPTRNITDHRTDDPTIYFKSFVDDLCESIDFEVSPADILSRYSSYTAAAFDVCSRLPYHLEIMVEKSTIHDVLEPIARRFRCNLLVGTGELSTSAMNDLVDRVKASGKPARIFYISDFDPAGQSMPVAAAVKIYFELIKEDLDLDIKLKPIALTADQCEKYKLPRTPIKDTEKRRDAFEERFGDGATELDALEALYPGELANIITEAIEPYFDRSVVKRCDEAEAAARTIWREKLEEIAQMIPEIRQAVAVDLCHLVPEPSTKIVDEIGADWLFDSSRNYEAQLAVFKCFQGKAGTL